MKKLLLIPLIMLMTSCSMIDSMLESDEGALLFQYSTVKAIRTLDGIDAGEVLSFTEKVRPLITDEVDTVEAVMTLVKAQVPWDDMLPEDVLIVEFIFNDVTARLESEVLLPEEIRVSTLTILDWIADAALLAG